MSREAGPGAPGRARATRRPWHADPAEVVLTALETSASGLSEAEAVRRQALFGPNRLPPPARTHAWRILIDQLRSVVVLLLGGAAAVSLAMGDLLEAASIAVVLVINTVLGFVTELRARRAMEALGELETIRAAVFRDGHLHQVAADRLVPGDVIELRQGQTVPADARLLTASEAHASEAALTGESLPVAKDAAQTLDPATPLGDRVNVVFKGTLVTSGTARAMVTATGVSTEMGRVGQLVGTLVEERTPLERRLDLLGRRLAWLALGVAAIVGLLSAVQGASWTLSLQLGIALAVAAVPEALPAVATIALAVGLRRMARRNALVRRLPAVQSLGATTVVCTDKTRTLTSGEMPVVRVWVDDEEVALDPSTADGHVPDAAGRLLDIAAAASRPQAVADVEHAAWTGDPVDRAVLAAASRLERPGRPAASLIETAVLPFSSERQLLASFRRDGERILACVKGAPRRVIGLSDSVWHDGAARPLTDGSRARLLAANEAFAARVARARRGRRTGRRLARA